MIKDFGTVERYQIYIGMNDKEKMKQLCPTKDFIKIVSNICSDYKIAFSMHEIQGAYMMSNGTFITEKSLVLSISGFTKEQVFKLADELRLKFNQESVMISLEKPELYYLTDKN